MIKTQVVVIGSGPGGYTAAFRAADSSSLYSLTALAGSIAISAFSRKIFFQFCRFLGVILLVLAEPKLDSLSLTQQCALLGLNRSSYYYQNKENQTKREIKAHINQVFEDIPI
jgi:hypothetical protein